MDEAEFLQSHIDQHGFLSFLGLTVEDLEPGRLKMSVPYDEKLTNMGPSDRGQVHGGVAATIADTAGGLCVRSTLDDPTEVGVATIDLNISYLRPATDDLVCTANVVRTGSTVGVAEMTVESTTPEGKHKEVAVGRGSFRIFR